MRTEESEKEEKRRRRRGEKEEEAVATMVTVMKDKQQKEEKQRVLMGKDAGAVARMSPPCISDGRWRLVSHVTEPSCNEQGAQGSHTFWTEAKSLDTWTQLKRS